MWTNSQWALCILEFYDWVQAAVVAESAKANVREPKMGDVLIGQIFEFVESIADMLRSFSQLALPAGA
jgi:hypothetical protein